MVNLSLSLKLTAIASAVRKIVEEFLPSSLFGPADQGYWYDNQDLLNYMGELGPELVTNGSLSNNGSGWTVLENVGNVTFANNRLEMLGGNFLAGQALVGLDPNKTYKIEWDQQAAGSFFLRFGASTTNTASFSGSGKKVAHLKPSASGGIYFVQSGNVAGDWVDNISVREVLSISNCTMFQDTAGTIPVTAVEQPVGLQLDKSRGLELGPELVTNGDFSNGTTGWNPINVSGSCTLAVVNGRCEVTVVSGFNLGLSGGGFTMQAGKTYKVSLDYIKGSYPQTNMGFGVAEELVVNLVNGLNTFYYTPASNGVFRIRTIGGWTASGVLFSVDNISIREIRGNHRISPGPTTSRPILRARYNLLTFSEDLTNVYWFGGQNITRALSDHYSATGARYTTITATSDVNHCRLLLDKALFGTQKFSVTAKAGTHDRIALVLGTPFSGAWFDLTNGTTGRLTDQGAIISSSISSDGAGGWECSLITSTTAVWSQGVQIVMIAPGATTYIPGAVSGKTVLLTKADFRHAEFAHLPYQRITTATDYDTVGFPLYLDTDGADDWMRTAATVDFSGSDKLTLIQGLHKRNDNVSMFNELSPLFSGNQGSFFNVTGTNESSFYSSSSRGANVATTLQTAKFNPSQYPAPDTAIISITHDIPGDLSRIWRNGVVGIDGTGEKGTGNFRNDHVYFYSRAGTGIRFNGRDYGQFAISRLLSDEDRAKVQNVFNVAMGGIY
jgi:hypothetical protein